MSLLPELTTSAPVLVLAAIAAYLFGAIPFGIVYARLFGLGNLRAIGSGNIGATNVLRTGNRLAAFLTLISDAGKGGVAVLIVRAALAEDAAQLAGLCAVLGHLFPVWLRFQGGKGVATFLGTALALSLPVGIAACLTWLAVALVMRISSLSALVAVALTPVWMIVFDYRQAAALGVVLATIVWQRHSANIKRLIAGQEPRIGKK